jgi:hypoxanthine phosphoribosyltransferase
MQGDIGRILLHHDQISERVRQMAAEIAGVYDQRKPSLTLVPVLSGSIIFLADLIRELPLKMKIALVQISAYPGRAVEAADPQTVIELTGEVQGRDVLIVDDILDSGRLLRKPSKAPPDVQADFVGFDIDDLFVVGYGLDFDDHYRNYPHIGVLRPELMP